MMKRHNFIFIWSILLIVILLCFIAFDVREDMEYEEEIMELDIALQKAEQRAENNEMMMYEAYEDNFELYDQLRQIGMNNEAEMYMEDVE